MIQTVMYFVLGLLTAGLLALAIAPAIWRRADRLARGRIEASLPMSRAEIQAEKDQLRAGFAISIRSLETKVEQLEANASGQMLEIGRNRTEIVKLEADQSAKAETITALEQKIDELGSDLEGAEARILEAQATLTERDTALAEQAQRVAELEADRAAALVLTEEQKLELVARDTTIGNLNDSLASAKASEAQTGLARDALTRSLEQEEAKLVAEQRRAGGLEARIAAFETERTDRLATLERRAAEIDALQAELAAERLQREAVSAETAQLEGERTERLRELTRRSEEVDALKAELQTLRAARELAGANGAGAASPTTDHRPANGDNVHKAIAAAEEEKAALEARIATLEGDQTRLKTENAELKRVAGPDWETMRTADQKLRDRLSEVATAVIQMTRTDGAPSAVVNHENGNGEATTPHTAPDARSAEAESTPEATPTPQVQPAQPTKGRSLAERIRALQHAAARH